MFFEYDFGLLYRLPRATMPVRNCSQLVEVMNKELFPNDWDEKVDSVGNLKSTHKWQNEPIACGVMFTYESLCEVGFYNVRFKMREGHELMGRYLEKFNLFNLPLPLYRYRIHEKNRTKNTKELSKFDNYFEEQRS